MINKWQEQHREDITRNLAITDARIDEDKPDPFKHHYTYLTREMVQALLEGKAVYYYDGEYSHRLLLCEVTTE